MFLKCSSIFRHLPSLISGFRGADFPPFNQYYEDAKTASVLLFCFGFPHSRYHLRCNLVLYVSQGGYIYPFLTRISFLTLIRLYVVRMETVGSPKFPWIPFVHLHYSQTPVGLLNLTFIGLSILLPL